VKYVYTWSHNIRHGLFFHTNLFRTGGLRQNLDYIWWHVDQHDSLDLSFVMDYVIISLPVLLWIQSASLHGEVCLPLALFGLDLWLALPDGISVDMTPVQTWKCVCAVGLAILVFLPWEGKVMASLVKSSWPETGPAKPNIWGRIVLLSYWVWEWFVVQHYCSCCWLIKAELLVNK
jgi:hypothetical protein